MHNIKIRTLEQPFASNIISYISTSTPSIIKTNSKTKEIKKLGPTAIEINLVSYFQPWITICYYMLIIPFKINHNGHAYYAHHNQFQRVKVL